MDVSATGTGSPILDSPVRLGETSTLVTAAVTAANGPTPVTTAGSSNETEGDTAGHLLQLLSAPQIRNLLNRIDAQQFPQDPAILEGLLETAGSAAARHDVPRALAALTEYVNRNPEHASTILTSPHLSQIQGDARELLRQITMTAKSEAIRLIATAGELVGASAKHSDKLNGPGALIIAERLVETGQLVNYLRASELSQAVTAFYARPVPEMTLDTARRAARGRLPSEKPGRRLMSRRIKAWWRKVPLLVLLIGWLGLGAAAGALALLAGALKLAGPATVQAVFELWGVGFLGLVVIQFWITVRGSKS